jgi:hypothetical protein
LVTVPFALTCCVRRPEASYVAAATIPGIADARPAPSYVTGPTKSPSGYVVVSRRPPSSKVSAVPVGHDAYYDITGNSRMLATLRHWTARIWRKWLGRRSNRRWTWEKMKRLLAAFPLPAPCAIHSTLLLT